MNSKNKGDIAESIALSEFIKRNIQVSIPFGDNARYDLIAEFNGKLNRIQVKYCGQFQDNSIVCPCASSTNHTTNKHYDNYYGQIDYFVFYLKEWDIPILVPIEYIGNKKSIIFRKMNKEKRPECHYIEDFSFDKILEFQNENDDNNDDKKEYKENDNTCIDCGIKIARRSQRCSVCAAKARVIPVRELPLNRQDLKNLIRTMPFSQIGVKFNVSDNQIRKWCIKLNLPSTKTEIKKYSDEEWNKI